MKCLLDSQARFKKHASDDAFAAGNALDGGRERPAERENGRPVQRLAFKSLLSS